MGFLKDLVKDPVRTTSETASALYGWGADAGILPNFNDEGSFNEQVGKGLSEDKKRNPMAPNRGAAGAFANNQLSNDMRRRQASQTLFTSGQGVLDTPLVASAILLGS